MFALELIDKKIMLICHVYKFYRSQALHVKTLEHKYVRTIFMKQSLLRPKDIIKILQRSSIKLFFMLNIDSAVASMKMHHHFKKRYSSFK